MKKAKSKLKKTYTEELAENTEFYKMYDFDYFVEQVDIEKFDNVSYDDDSIFGQLLEMIFAEPSEYMITDLHSSINEIESDLNSHANSFYKFAHHEYMRYVGKIETVIEKISTFDNEM